MSMSRKDYVAISEITRNILQGTNFLIPMINTLSDYFKADNPQFDKTKFKTACLNGGIKDGNFDIKSKSQEVPVTQTEESNNHSFENIDTNSPYKSLGRIDRDRIAAIEKMIKKNQADAEAHRKKKKR